MDSSLERCLIALSRALPSDAVITDRDLCAAYARDESEAIGEPPAAVLRPASPREVAAVLAAANQHLVPVTPRGGGTGRTGGAVPMRGGLVVTNERMRSRIDIEPADSLAVVDPGVITQQLHEAVEARGLFWGPDPNSAAQCTIAGNIAENASGPRGFKYGATRDWVRGLEIVTATGEPMRVGRRTSKGVTGYDLTSLMVGSEGTLGFVTAAYLRLAPLPERVITALVFLPSLTSIGPAIDAALRARVVPRCVELLDDHTLSVLRERAPIAIPAAARALLVIELDGPELVIDHELERLGNALAEHTALEIGVARTASERERFWGVRHQMSRALRSLARHKLSEDVVVPRSKIADLLAATRRIAEARAIRMPVYGHAGDGNLHVNLLWDHDEERAGVELAIRELFETTVALGGTLSGEHGIGALKAPYLSIEQSEAHIELARRIKSSFDPRGILNPGKIFPRDARPAHREC